MSVPFECMVSDPDFIKPPFGGPGEVMKVNNWEVSRSFCGPFEIFLAKFCIEHWVGSEDAVAETSNKVGDVKEADESIFVEKEEAAKAREHCWCSHSSPRTRGQLLPQHRQQRSPCLLGQPP